MDREKMSFYLLLGLLFLLPVLFIFQGLDFTDSGYILVTSRDILKDPANVPAGAYSTFLSMFFNGLWMKLTSPLGLIGARMGIVVVYWAIFSASYFILRDFMPKMQVLSWLLLTFLCTARTFWISYNDITVLLALLSLAVLYWGYKFQKNWYLFLAGFLCGLNLFSRISNVAMLMFGLLPFLMNSFFPDDKKRNSLKESLLFYVGWLFACCCMVVAMKATGYWDFFFEGLRAMKDIATDSTSHHSLQLLLSLFVSDHIRVLSLGFLGIFLLRGISLVTAKSKIVSLFLLFLLGYIAFLFGWIGSNSVLYVSFYFWVALLLCLIFQVVIERKEFFSRVLFFVNSPSPLNGKLFYLNIIITFFALGLSMKYLSNKWITTLDMLFAASYLLLLLFLTEAFKRKGKNLFFVLMAAFLLFFTVPLGSNDGIQNALYGLWLALPLGLNWLWDHSSSYFTGQFQRKSVHWLGLIAAVFLLMMGGASSFLYTYRDTADRLAMSYQIEHPKLRHIFTTRQRAEVVESLLEIAKDYIKPGDYVLGYHTIPLFYYLTDTRPYLYNSWPLLSSPAQLSKLLQRALIERPTLPIVVRSKYSLQNSEWPIEHYINETDDYQKNIELLETFLTQRCYKKVWENEYFEILVP